MNKKFFLSVFLLGALTLSSGVLTSCIDNDEPEGITTLRGAKAELLRAKAALELAKAETEKQQALYVAAKAEVEKATAEKEKAEAERIKAEAETEKARAAVELAKVAQEEAKAEQEKAEAQRLLAEAEQELAKAEVEKAKAEAAIDSINARLEETLLKIQADVAIAQAALIEAEAALKIAQVTMTEAEKTKLDALYNAVYGISVTTTDPATGATTTTGSNGTLKQLQDAQNALFAAQKALMEAEYSQEKYFAGLEEAVTEAKGTLAGVQAALESITKLEAATTIQDVETEKNELMKYYGDYDSTTPTKEPTTGTAAAEIADIKVAQARELISSDAQCTLDDAKDYYDYVTSSGSHTTDGQKFTLKKHELKIANEKVKGKFEDKYNELLPAADNVKFYNVANSYTLAESKNKNYSTTVNHDNKKIAFNWQATINKVSMSAEEVQNAQCAIDALKEDAADADTAHMEAVAHWEKMHQQKEEGKALVEVDQTNLKAAVAAFNTKFAALDAAVTAYNSAFDAKVKEDSAAYYNSFVDKVQFVAYKNWVETSTNTNEVPITVPQAAATVAEIDAVVNTYATAIAANGNNMTAATVIAAGHAEIATAVEDNFTATVIKGVKKDAAYAGLHGATKDVNSYTDGSFNTYFVPAAAIKGAENERGTWSNLTDTSLGKKAKAIATAEAELTDAANKAGSYAYLLAQVGVDNTGAKLSNPGEKSYVVEMNNNAQDFKLSGDKYTAAFNALTGINAKYNVADDLVGNTDPTKMHGTVSNSDWTVDEIKSNNGSPAKYVTDDNHKRVIRVKVLDAALATYAEPVFKQSLADAAWEKASKDAFGVNFNQRHAEIPASDVTYNTTTSQWEYEGTKVEGTLAAMKDANKKVAVQQEILDAQADIAVVKADIDSIAKLVYAEVQVAIDAEKAAKAAKKAAQDAVDNLGNKYTAQIDSIMHIVKHKYDLSNAIDGVIEAYYGNTVFYYINEEGEVVEFPDGVTGPFDSNFEGVMKWITATKNIYTKKDTNLSGAALEASKGKVADAEKTLADAEDTLEHAKEANYGSKPTEGTDGTVVYDYFELYQIDIDRAQAEVERITILHNAALAQLQAFIEAMSK